MRERFVLDRKKNILFINFAGLKIESREQVDEMAALVREAYETQGRRLYAIVNYEETEIAPEIVDYYGERIKELQDRHALSTVRYSSSGFTRSVLRYLGAAKDLESNTFATAEEAVRAIQEIQSRSRDARDTSAWTQLDPRRSILGKLLLAWLALLAALFAVYFLSASLTGSLARIDMIRGAILAAAFALLLAACVTAVIVYVYVIRPLRKMESLARRLVIGGATEPLKVKSQDETGRLAQAMDEAARWLGRDIERLSGLYHISLMMATGTEVSKICELLTGKVARLLDAQMCVILLYDGREKILYAQMPAYGVRDEQVRALRYGVEDKGIATWVLKTGEPYMTNDAAVDPLIDRAAADLFGVMTMLAVPLQAGEHRVGTLEVMNKQGGFLEEDKRLVTIFASQAAHLISSALLFEQVRESEERYRQIFESTLDGLYRSMPDGRLLTVNPALAAMLGYSEPQQLIGQSLFDDLFVDPAAAERLREELSGRGHALDVECLMRHREGPDLPARVSIRVVTDKSDNEAYHLGIVKDITEQKKLSEQLIISERLAVVGELIAGVAHEVRNPLFGITTTLSALARRLEGREAVKPFLDVVMSEVDRLNHLMEQLLEHSRPIRLDKDDDIRSVIEEVLGELSSQSRERNIALNFNCRESLPCLRFDRRKVHGVFTNLLDNALEHTGPGGQINVVVESNARPEIHIEVSDNGAGISSENLSRVFEPFFTTRAAGTGLGLAIVRKTIHDHGGTISVRSEPGRGTAFTITLPLASNGKENAKTLNAE